ncbi:hypothetical protein CSUB01_08280, partial [Colletotrichum sublineola]
MRSTGLISWLAVLSLSNGALIPRRDGWEDPMHSENRLYARQPSLPNTKSTMTDASIAALSPSRVEDDDLDTSPTRAEDDDLDTSPT